MADWGGAGKGAITGATTGASVGSIFPGIGTGIGAGIGSIIGGIGGLFGGKKKRKRGSTLDKRQQKVNKSQADAIFGKGELADMYNYDPEAANEVFDKTIANPAYRKYEEDLAPKITGQFRSQGLMNSSYAGDALAKSARDIQEGLDAQRSKFLYKDQAEARTAKRSAVEKYQDRQTFNYEGGERGFDIQSILGSITPEAITKLKDYFK